MLIFGKNIHCYQGVWGELDITALGRKQLHVILLVLGNVELFQQLSCDGKRVIMMSYGKLPNKKMPSAQLKEKNYSP